MSPKQRERILEKIRSGRATRAERLLLKQEGLCFYCWTTLEKDITKEHLDAKANGGSNEPVNLRVAHMRCNGVVGSLSVDLKWELHETGRDKGPDAFWQKALEYQRKYGAEKKAYSRGKGGSVKTRPHVALANANTHPSLENSRDLTPEDAELELQKLQLSSPGRALRKEDKMRLFQEETELRKSPDYDGHHITLRDFYRIYDLFGLAGLAQARQRAA